MNTKPLTLDEVIEAADIFFPIYECVKKRMPDAANVEDVLKVTEQVCNLAQKLRVQKKMENQPFGFNKKQNESEPT